MHQMSSFGGETTKTCESRTHPPPPGAQARIENKRTSSRAGPTCLLLVYGDDPHSRECELLDDCVASRRATPLAAFQEDGAAVRQDVQPRTAELVRGLVACTRSQPLPTSNRGVVKPRSHDCASQSRVLKTRPRQQLPRRIRGVRRLA